MLGDRRTDFVTFLKKIGKVRFEPKKLRECRECMENVCLMFPVVPKDVHLFASGLDIMNEQGKETRASFLELVAAARTCMQKPFDLSEPMNSDSNEFR